MRAYSLNLRQKVVVAVARGDSSTEEYASALGVGHSFVKKMRIQQRETGAPIPQRHGS